MRATEPNELSEAVESVRRHPKLLDDLAALYVEAEAELRALGQSCRQCGRCCDFPQFGHRLYVSTAELALLTQESPEGSNPAAEGQCPYLRGGLCTARQRRTLGCRAFSCTGDSQAENQLYERFHARIRQLHTLHDVAYLYLDVMAALA